MTKKTHTQNLDHFGTQEGVPSWVVSLLPVLINFLNIFFSHFFSRLKLHLLTKNHIHRSLESKVIHVSSFQSTVKKYCICVSLYFFFQKLDNIFVSLSWKLQLRKGLDTIVRAVLLSHVTIVTCVIIIQKYFFFCNITIISNPLPKFHVSNRQKWSERSHPSRDVSRQYIRKISRHGTTLWFL